jgi:hypothetical protein
MPIIIVSSESPAVEEQIAVRAAKALGYKTLGPEVLPAIAAKRAIPEAKLAESLGRTPTPWWRRQAKGRQRYLAWVEAEVLDRLAPDNIVCWGLAAHLYVLGVSHALKARLLPDSARQAEELAGQRGVTPHKAAKLIEGTRLKRSQWSLAAFGQNELDPSMYDLVINLGQIDPDEAVGALTTAVGYRKFQPMTYSMSSLADIALAAKVKARLLGSLSDIRVQARDGTVVVTSKALKRERRKKTAAIKSLAGEVPGVNYVEVHLINYVIRAAAESFR